MKSKIIPWGVSFVFIPPCRILLLSSSMWPVESLLHRYAYTNEVGSSVSNLLNDPLLVLFVAFLKATELEQLLNVDGIFSPSIKGKAYNLAAGIMIYFL